MAISVRTILAVLPIVAVVAWNVLDASPSLYFYDLFATQTGGWQLHSLEGKSVWITGSSSGIGASLVCEVLQAGASHVVLSSRNREKMEDVAKRCQENTDTSSGKTHQVHIVPYDATEVENADATVDKAMALAGGNIDILILNAGVYQSKPALKTPQEERDWITRVNYQAPVDLAHAMITRGRWKERGVGHIVAVTSVMSHGPHGLSSTYAASKAALKSYFHSLSTEEYSWLRVDVACPGATDTGLWVNSNSKSTTGGAKMTPDRVAHLILTGAAGPYFLFYELWISKAAGLLWIWLSHYMPNVFHGFVHLLGYIRVAIWEKEQLDALDLPLLLHRFSLMLIGRYP